MEAITCRLEQVRTNAMVPNAFSLGTRYVAAKNVAALG